jgi:hypothetical protein
MDDDVSEAIASVSGEVSENKTAFDALQLDFSALKDDVDALKAVDTSKLVDQIAALDKRITYIEFWLGNILQAQVMSVPPIISFSPQG